MVIPVGLGVERIEGVRIQNIFIEPGGQGSINLPCLVHLIQQASLQIQK
jgi:hypothetical protein